MYPDITLRLPKWIAEEVKSPARCLPTLEERMAFVIRLAERNIQEGTGGPFGAAVFAQETGALIAPGVNIVVASHCSLAHAEAVAIMLAQQICKTFDLSADSLPRLELVTSAQPCIQCYGNIWWSGLQRLIVGASKADVERLTGFQEGPVPENWVETLEHRTPLPSIRVIRNVLREEACAVLQSYAENGGLVYNPDVM